MSAILREYSKDDVVDSQLGERKIDSEGAAISGVRMDVSKAYAGIPGLLQKVINKTDTSALTEMAGAYGSAPILFQKEKAVSENDTVSWREIKNRIDYIYTNLDHALTELDRETGFASKVKSQIKSGKKLFFKPNLVAPIVIDWTTHGEGSGAPVCTEWPLVAALMRWFHDKLDISYYQMALGEASASTFLFSAMFSRVSGKIITTEAVFEGRSVGFYGGWGFFFVRKYLSDRHPSSHKDDPMVGYEDSVAGRFIPPGRAGDRLMVYDLNKVQDDISKGRTVAVPDGANFKEITLHKAIIGGDPNDAKDLSDYPGCVLVNVPKLKIHAQDLLTNAIKNLGIGLYPTQCASGKDKNDTSWKYACPPTSNPTLKGKLPHSPWILKMDDNTGLPVKDENGEYIAVKTAGFPGTQADIIRAVQSQNVLMLHVVDAIDMINISHNPDGLAVRVPEGYVWSSLDCVALDLFCARYCFKTVPMFEALKLKEKDGWPTEFVHHVPVARVEGKNIVTEEGFDSPLFRYNLYRYAEKRGVGQQKYYVVGCDSLTETPLASLGGHLGRIDNAKFIELMTKTMYYNPMTILHDLQKTILSYIKAHDDLTGSSLYKQFMDSFDENNDEVIDYDEMGRKGYQTAVICMNCYSSDLMLASEYGSIKGNFMQLASMSKYGDRNWNPQGHDFLENMHLVFKARVAFEMSQYGDIIEDALVPGMSWGKGMWPSWQMVTYILLTSAIYG
ncbi:MAG: DUF362 domain-containing protein, partial [Methanotrichaceae archaeon]|nr:DUF362 domain-containing protein [Methanotrichaceae archaeon]